MRNSKKERLQNCTVTDSSRCSITSQNTTDTGRLTKHLFFRLIKQQSTNLNDESRDTSDKQAVLHIRQLQQIQQSLSLPYLGPSSLQHFCVFHRPLHIIKYAYFTRDWHFELMCTSANCNQHHNKCSSKTCSCFYKLLHIGISLYDQTHFSCMQTYHIQYKVGLQINRS